jgi:hypothetical protein
MGLPSEMLDRWIGVEVGKAAICSEYILECLATSQLLSAEYNAIGNSNHFYPADFAAHSQFDHHQVTFRKFTSG